MPYRGRAVAYRVKRVYRAISRSSARKRDNARNPMRRPRCGTPFCCCALDVILDSYDRNIFQRSLPGKWRPVLACDSVNLTGGLHSKIHDDRRIDEKYGFLDPLFLNFNVKRYRKCHFGWDKSSLRWDFLTFNVIICPCCR